MTTNLRDSFSENLKKITFNLQAQYFGGALRHMLLRNKLFSVFQLFPHILEVLRGLGIYN